jgi:hypothetical protein
MLCRSYCQKELLPALRQSAAEEQKPVEWVYRLTVTPTADSDGIAVALSVRLTDKTHHRAIDKSLLTHTWDTQGRNILKQKNKKSEKTQIYDFKSPGVLKQPYISAFHIKNKPKKFKLLEKMRT